MPQPDELPDTPIDFRQYASKVLANPDPGKLARAQLLGTFRTRSIIGGMPEDDAAPPAAVFDVIDAGVEAARKAAADPTVPLSAIEQARLEAVVRLTDRPALLIQDDNFQMPPPRWQTLDTPYRNSIKKMLPGVGRIEIQSNGGRQLIGTGFVCADDLLMTNTHVVELMADPDPEGKTWTLRNGLLPTVDFKGEHELAEEKRFRIREVVLAFDRTDADRDMRLDMALLRVEPGALTPNGAPLPSPLAITVTAPDLSTNKDLYVIGYPWTDNELETPPEILKLIFAGIVQVKRLQPGEYGADFDSYLAFSHDCSTLGGNSGSCVIDLDEGRVIGLHFKGKYRSANYAIQLWKLAGHPKIGKLIENKGLNFKA